MSWKPGLVHKHPKLDGLLRDKFEEAAFLYDLYKTSTVTEVQQFKWALEES